MKLSSDFRPQTTFAASVISFTCLSTACVWQGNFVKLTVGVTSVVMRSLSAASVIALITEAPRYSRDCPVDHVEVIDGVKLSSAGTLNLRN